MEKHPILKIEKGISKKHRSLTSIFERVDHGKRGGVKATRTYQDGTHYSVIDPGMENFNNEEVRWEILAKINENGIRKIKGIIAKLDKHKIKQAEQSPIGFTPTITWYFHDPQEFTSTTLGGMYENLPPFIKEIDEAINGNLIVKGEEE